MARLLHSNRAGKGHLPLSRGLGISGNTNVVSNGTGRNESNTQTRSGVSPLPGTARGLSLGSNLLLPSVQPKVTLINIPPPKKKKVFPNFPPREMWECWPPTTEESIQHGQATVSFTSFNFGRRQTSKLGYGTCYTNKAGGRHGAATAHRPWAAPLAKPPGQGPLQPPGGSRGAPVAGLTPMGTRPSFPWLCGKTAFLRGHRLHYLYP